MEEAALDDLYIFPDTTASIEHAGGNRPQLRSPHLKSLYRWQSLKETLLLWKMGVPIEFNHETRLCNSQSRIPFS